MAVLGSWASHPDRQLPADEASVFSPETGAVARQVHEAPESHRFPSPTEHQVLEILQAKGAVATKSVTALLGDANVRYKHPESPTDPA